MVLLRYMQVYINIKYKGTRESDPYSPSQLLQGLVMCNALN